MKSYEGSMAASAAGHPDLVAGVAHRRDGLDVVQVAVGLEDLAHVEALAQLQEPFVFVGCVEQDRLAGLGCNGG